MARAASASTMRATPLLALLVLVLLLASSHAWKWGSLFDDGDSDSVVTVAADARGLYHPVLRTYRTVLLRVPTPDFGPPVVTRVRHVFGLPPPLPLPPPALPLAPRYGPPAAPSAPAPPPSAASTAAAVAAAVARTILEAHGFSRSFDVTDGPAAQPSGSRGVGRDLYWQGAVQSAVQGAIQEARARGVIWRRRRR